MELCNFTLYRSNKFEPFVQQRFDLVVTAYYGDDECSCDTETFRFVARPTKRQKRKAVKEFKKSLRNDRCAVFYAFY